jgi:hypothetical protein
MNASHIFDGIIQKIFAMAAIHLSDGALQSRTIFIQLAVGSWRLAKIQTMALIL